MPGAAQSFGSAVLERKMRHRPHIGDVRPIFPAVEHDGGPGGMLWSVDQKPGIHSLGAQAFDGQGTEAVVPHST